MSIEPYYMYFSHFWIILVYIYFSVSLLNHIVWLTFASKYRTYFNR